MRGGAPPQGTPSPSQQSACRLPLSLKHSALSCDVFIDTKHASLSQSVSLSDLKAVNEAADKYILFSSLIQNH